jgi:hypothetical protein
MKKNTENHELCLLCYIGKWKKRSKKKEKWKCEFLLQKCKKEEAKREQEALNFQHSREDGKQL